MEREIITTADGSKTIHLKAWNEQYHSKHGALQEAKHVYIKSGFQYMLEQSNFETYDILEIGFGTALNTMLTLIESKKRDLSIRYTAVEAYPVSKEELDELNYESLFPLDFSNFFNEIHTVKWNEFSEIDRGFCLNKQLKKFNEVNAQNIYDLIYFDAFGPRVQPELWSVSIFDKMHDALKQDGILVTYCAKGAVRRVMELVGFQVERLPGPPGKREMLRAIKKTVL